MALPDRYELEVIRDQDDEDEIIEYVLVCPQGRFPVPTRSDGFRLAREMDRQDRIARFGEEAVLKADREERLERAKALAAAFADTAFPRP